MTSGSSRESELRGDWALRKATKGAVPKEREREVATAVNTDVILQCPCVPGLMCCRLYIIIHFIPQSLGLKYSKYWLLVSVFIYLFSLKIRPTVGSNHLCSPLHSCGVSHSMSMAINRSMAGN